MLGPDRYKEQQFRHVQAVLESLSELPTAEERSAVMYLLKNEKLSGKWGRTPQIFESLGITSPSRQKIIKQKANELWARQMDLGLRWGQMPVLKKVKVKGKKTKYVQAPIIKATTFQNRLKRGVGPNYAFDYPKESLEKKLKKEGEGLLARLDAIAETGTKADRKFAYQVRRFSEAQLAGSDIMAKRWFRNFGANMKHAITKMDLSETMRKEIYGELPVMARMYKGMAELVESKYRLDNFETIAKFEHGGKKVAFADAEFGANVKAVDMKKWGKVPDTEEWGLLRNHWVRRDVLHYVDTITRGGPSKLWGRRLMPAWKMSKTVLNPGFHFRNLFSNTILNYLGGLGPWRVDIYAKAARELARKGPLYREAVEAGALGFEFYGGEIPKLERFLRKETNVLDAMINHAGKQAVKLGGRAGNLFRAEEQWFKLAKYIHNTQSLGMSAESAAKDALKWTFDYSHVSPLTRGLRESIMPFATFQLKMIPAMMESIVRAPWRLGLGIMAWNQLSDMSVDNLGISEPEWKKIRNNFPDYIKSHFPLPYRDDEGRIQMVDFGYIFPWGVFWDVGNHGMMRTVIQNPVINISAALTYNQDFAGRPIWYETMDPSEKLKLALEHVYQQLMPSVFFMGYDWQLAQDAGLLPHASRLFDPADSRRPLRERTTRPGVPTTGQIAARHVGIKTYARSEDELAVGKYWSNMAKTQELMKRFRKDVRRSPGERQPERLRRRQARLQAKIREIWSADVARPD
jgi:hypothetical protein